MEATEFSDANETINEMTHETKDNITVNLSKTFAEEEKITTAPTIFTTAPNRYNTGCLLKFQQFYVC